MKLLLLAVASASMMLSCSKPAQENSSTDSTATTYAAPQVTASEQTKLVTLTAEEMQQVHLAIFLRLHDFQLFGGEPGWVAVKEEYNSSQNNFTYSLVRGNPLSGMFNDRNTEGGYAYPTPDDMQYKREQELEEANESEEDSTSDASDEGLENEYSSDQSSQGWVVNTRDTLSGSGMFIAILESKPEDPVKTVRCRISGYISWENFYSPNYGNPVRQSYSYRFEDIVVQLVPQQFTRDQLYLKAAVMPLSEKDVAGMNKDEIGYLRNEIFARHGHEFKTEKMKTYFAAQPWYRGTYGDATGNLNKFERQNVEFLKKKEG